MERMMFEIFWDNSISKVFSYGSKIEFKKNKEVHFRNSFCSPGETIIQWNSNISFELRNNGLQLPLLRIGSEYQLTPYLIASPKGSVIIKLSIYDRIDQLIDSVIINADCNSFIYPSSAYSYTIELINVGNKDLRFKKIILALK